MPTSQAQRDALKRYYQKTKANQKRVTISLNAEEYAASRERMKANGATPVDVWRAGIATLPPPTEENAQTAATTDGSQTPNA